MFLAHHSSKEFRVVVTSFWLCFSKSREVLNTSLHPSIYTHQKVVVHLMWWRQRKGSIEKLYYLITYSISFRFQHFKVRWAKRLDLCSTCNFLSSPLCWNCCCSCSLSQTTDFFTFIFFLPWLHFVAPRLTSLFRSCPITWQKSSFDSSPKYKICMHHVKHEGHV